MSLTNQNEDLAICPYNPSHRIAKFKLLPHVHRCKDGLKSNKKLYHCKKDSLIMFFSDKKETHLKECQYCYNIYNNVGKDETTLKDSTIKLKKNLKNCDEQKSVSFINMNNDLYYIDNDNLTINLNNEDFDMMNLNNSVMSIPSIFDKQEFNDKFIENKKLNEIKNFDNKIKGSKKDRNNINQGSIFIVTEGFYDNNENDSDFSLNKKHIESNKITKNYIYETKIFSQESQFEIDIDNTLNLSQFSRKI